MKGAAGDFDDFAGIEFIDDDLQFFMAHGGAQFGDGGFGDFWPVIAEMDDVPHSAGVFDPAEKGFEVEARKKIIDEERFGGPGGALSRGALKADARQEHFNRQVLPQAGGGDVLVFGLGPHTKPFLGINGCRTRAVQEESGVAG